MHFNNNRFNRVLDFRWPKVEGETTSHCCEHMEMAVNFRCKTCPDIWTCEDSLLFYSPIFDEYGLIIHDGSASYVLIEYCPWCGSQLPSSRRDEWFDLLEKQGFDQPLQQEIPLEFKTNAWYRKELQSS